MTDFRGIGGVSATLRALLADRMELPDGVIKAPVTSGPPTAPGKDGEAQQEDPRVNLFLYRVTENGHLQNQEIPGRGTRGAYGHPPLSLNLHYLLTAYGNDKLPADARPPQFDDTTAQFLLGSAMRVLHDVPTVTDRLTTVKPTSGLSVLHESLRKQFEQVKLCLEPLSLEDITKVWTALTLRYRLSAAYVVNVVQIESRRPTRLPRPVGEPTSSNDPPLPTDPPGPGPWIHTLTIRTPTIRDVRVRRAGETAERAFPYARIGDTLVLRGTALSGPETRVAFGDLRVRASFASSDRVEAALPDVTVPGGPPIPPEQQLQPGVRTVSVVVSDPLVPHTAFSSNDVAFAVVPRVDQPTLAYAAGPPRTLEIGGSRLVADAPGGETIIGRGAVARAAYTAATPTRIVVPIPDTLPARNVPVLISGELGDVVTIGSEELKLRIAIGHSSTDLEANLPTKVPREALPAIVAALIRDAAPADPRFTGAGKAPKDRRFTDARVTMLGHRLVIVAGELAEPFAVTPIGTSALAGALGFPDPGLPGAPAAAFSGALTGAPPLSAQVPGVAFRIGTRPPVTVPVPRAASLETLAAGLEQAIVAAATDAGYAGTRVTTTDAQLLVVPGAPEPVSFAPAPGDDTTVVQLQLHARFALRVRMNGAESTDEAFVELPR